MERDKVYESFLNFNDEISVDDWNRTVELLLKKYFTNETAFNVNKEVLRTEIVQYIRILNDSKYLELFEWTINMIKECFTNNQSIALSMWVDSYNDVVKTDLRWMTFVLTQPDASKFTERDKINYYFKIIDEIIEGVFKPRFYLLHKFYKYKVKCISNDNSHLDFGKLVSDFALIQKEDTKLYTEDPFFSIPINQWRNIACHKSFSINTENIILSYGKNNIKTIPIEYKRFYEIVDWISNTYRVLRLAQVMIDINYIDEITASLKGKGDLRNRFEGTLFHIIHNMQIVGFKFASTQEINRSFCLNLYGKSNHDLKSSLFHASQMLDQLSLAIYDDEFTKGNFDSCVINIVDNKMNTLATATISISKALEKVFGNMSLEEYIENIEFKFNNNA